VTAYPVDYRTGPGALAIHATAGDGLFELDIAVREGGGRPGRFSRDLPAVPAAVSRDHGPGNTASV
jgi:hypothetical protein